MSLRVQSFTIRGGDAARKDEEMVSSFLRTASVERIETAFAGDSWHLLVLHRDMREKEEAEQIASVITSALKVWRAKISRQDNVNPGKILSDDMVARIAQYVPTTPLELRVVAGSGDGASGPHDNEIVQVVRKTLDDLS